MVNFSEPVSMQVHRFGERVAMYIGDGQTVYLTPATARKLTRAINKTAKEISDGVRFVDSKCGTFSHTQESGGSRSTDSYKIVRGYFRGGQRVIKRGLTLEEAQAHCQNPETSSSTCTKAEGKRRTARMGAWFDGYEKE